MDFNFEKTMSEISDVELIKIVTTDRDNYQEAAIIAAENEFKKRNIPIEKFEKTKQIYETVKLEQEVKAKTPLELHWKIIGFFLPLMFMFFIAGAFKVHGYEKKANELAKWAAFGIGFYIILAIIF